MRVAILYDAGSDDWSPQDVAAVVGNVHEVRDVLRRRGHEVELLPVRLGDFRWITRVRRAELVFNLCEGINGHARFEDYVVGTLELTGVPFTGCRHWATTIAHRKHVANTLLSAAGLPVPAFVLAQANKTPAEFPLPAIVKPAAEDASVGIDNGAVCTSKRALKKRVALMLEQFEEVLVQEYVAGREFNVGFVGKRMLPIAEIRFDGMPEGTWPIVSYAAKWIPGSPEDEGTLPVCPAEVDAELAKRIGQVARDAWLYVSGGEGYGRVDLRLNEEGQPYVLEVNPCPDLSSNAGLARMGRAFGWSYDDLVMQVVDEALMRSQSSTPPRPWSAGSPPRERHPHLTGPPTTHPGRPRPDRGPHPCRRRLPRRRGTGGPRGLRRRRRRIPRLSRPWRGARRPAGRLDLLGSHPVHPGHLRSLLDGRGPGRSGRRDRHRPDPGHGGRGCAVSPD